MGTAETFPHNIKKALVTGGGGCTAFGAWGAATANGHLLTGRNFDWEAHPARQPALNTPWIRALGLGVCAAES